MTKTMRRLFGLLAALLLTSMVSTGCSLIPDAGSSGGGSSTSQTSDAQDQQRDPVPSEGAAGGLVPDLGGLTGNAEACLSVTAVVLAGSTLALLSKFDSGGENTRKLADQVKESMKKVPAELKGDLENLLKVVNETAVDGKAFDENKFKTAMEPIGAWVDKNCGGQ
ncbi:hypothetical protein AS189_03540 [Arthrobacter alpinus]|uniref:Lipoprotein n=2 Tax=Arthrobacter alpinus TaxID=656366 RepID=A0A0S2LW33_9MICC|nr:hypothetical protein AS189_03540 [Arthrobacter alpinus]